MHGKNWSLKINIMNDFNKDDFMNPENYHNNHNNHNHNHENIDERRNNSLQEILLALGELKGLTQVNITEIKELKEKVHFQNGRVGKNELWQAEIKGTINTLKWCLAIMILPVIFIILTEVVKNIKF